jgi:multiple sugar transport system permease protein
MIKPLAVRVINKTVIYLVLGLFALWILMPFSIILSTSIKTWQEASSLGFSLLPREGYDFSGYAEVFTYHSSSDDALPSVVRGFINTLLYVIPPTVFGLLTSSLAAYAFAKLRFKRKRIMFSALIGTMMIPGTIMLTPTYMIYDMIRWVDTPFPLIIPGMFGAAACVFFMRQFFTGVPDALIEAAKLDGMGYFAIFFKIMVPLSVPALLAQGILGFIGGYNDYFGPYIYLQSPEMYTLQIALRSFSGTYTQKVNVIMAGTIMALIPTLVIYIAAQRYFIEGISTAGMKL